MDTAQLVSAADSLWVARASGRPCEALTATYPQITIPDAYEISRLNLGRRVQEAKVRRIGRKIGLTSEAVQRQLGVEQPDFGYLTSDMKITDGGIAPNGSWIQAKAEGEVAFILGRDLKGPGVTRESAAAATDHVVAAIEIIDSRIKDWKIRIQDTIADNASSAAFVLGAERRKLSDIDLPSAAMALTRNGKVESSGVGRACLGDPLNAVVWLANALAEYEEGLLAGNIVLSGAYGPVVPFAQGDRCVVTIEGLGAVSCGYGA